MIENDALRPSLVDHSNLPAFFHILIVTALFEERDALNKSIAEIFQQAVGQLNAGAEDHVRYAFKPIVQNVADRAHQLQRWALTKTRNGVVEPEPLTIGLTTLPDMGNVYAALHTHQILSKHRPQLIFLLGICGSADKKELLLGDVLVSTHIYWINAHKLKTASEIGAAIYEPWNREQFRTRPVLESTLRTYFNEYEENLPSNWAEQAFPKPKIKNTEARGKQRVKFGPLVATNTVVDHEGIRDAYKKISKALGIEMESAGMYAAINLYNNTEPKPPEVFGVVFKGVSDLCAEKNDDGWRAIAGYNAAFAACSFLFSNVDFIENVIFKMDRGIPIGPAIKAEPV